MQKVQLYIEGNRIDLFKDDEVSLTSSIQNVKDIAKVFTDFTKTFAIPASPNNNKIFKHFYNFNIDDGFDARTKKSAAIELNSIPFKKGKIKLDGVPMKNNKPYSYKITFFGNTVNIKDLFGEDKLSDIATSFFSHFDREYTSLKVREALQNAIDVTIDSTTYNDALLTPLITHSTRLFYDSGTNFGAYYVDNKVNELGGNLRGNTTFNQTNHHGVYYGELKYALRLHIIITAIQQHYGITFSDDFFSTSNDIYHELYMWLHRKEGDVFPDNQIITTALNNLTVGVFSNLQSSIVVKSTDQTTIIVDDTTTSVDTRRVTITLQTRTSTNPDYTLVLTKNGTVLQRFNVDDSSSAKTFNTTYFEIVNSFNSDEYQILVEAKSTVSFVGSGLTFVKFNMTKLDESSSTDTTINLASVISTSSNQNFIIQQQLPEMKVIDFITSLFKMFNLTAFAEDDGTIKVQTLDDFYASSITTWDLNKFTETDFEVNPSLPFKEIDFSYSGLKTFLANDHEKRFSLGWGSDDYKTNENETGQVYDFNTKIYKVQPQFEHMKFERIIDVETNGVKRSQVGWYVNEQKNPYVNKPLLFYPHRVNGSNTSAEYAIRFLNELTFLNSNSSQDIATYYVPSNSLSLSASTSTKNINFGLEENEYDFASNTQFDKTLFKLFYKSYIEKVFNVKNRITKLKAQLPLNFILQHTLADKILFKGNRYIINSLKINMNTGKSNLELLTDIRVANEILIGTVAGDNAAGGCLPSSTTITKKVFYELDATFGNSIVIYENESLSIPFNGNAKFYKLDLFGVIKVIQISSTGVTSNYQNC